jgi:hypothetical protein
MTFASEEVAGMLLQASKRVLYFYRVFWCE